LVLPLFFEDVNVLSDFVLGWFINLAILAEGIEAEYKLASEGVESWYCRFWIFLLLFKVFKLERL
jgi:hypothetical protein